MKKEHKILLAELRKWVAVWLVSFVGLFALSYNFRNALYSIIIQPIKSMHISENTFIYTNIWESFLTDLSLACNTAFIFSFPVLLFCIYKFVAPSLYKNEKKMLATLLVLGVVLAVIAISVLYFLILPRAVEFLIAQSNNISKPMFRISEYVSTFFHLIIGFVIVFQIPLVLFGLAKLGIISTNFMSKYRKIAIVIIFIIAAFITPPDVPSQLICASILIVIYELTNLAIRVLVSKNRIKTTKKKRIKERK